MITWKETQVVIRKSLQKKHGLLEARESARAFRRLHRDLKQRAREIQVQAYSEEEARERYIKYRDRKVRDLFFELVGAAAINEMPWFELFKLTRDEFDLEHNPLEDPSFFGEVKNLPVLVQTLFDELWGNDLNVALVVDTKSDPVSVQLQMFIPECCDHTTPVPENILCRP